MKESFNHMQLFPKRKPLIKNLFLILPLRLRSNTVLSSESASSHIYHTFDSCPFTFSNTYHYGSPPPRPFYIFLNVLPPTCPRCSQSNDTAILPTLKPRQLSLHLLPRPPKRFNQETKTSSFSR